MATIPTPEQGKPILDFSAGTFDGSSNLFQSRNGATEHVSGDDVADYVNTSRIYNGLDTESKTPVGAINEINAKDASDIPYDNTASGLTATDVNAAIDEIKSTILTVHSKTVSVTFDNSGEGAVSDADINHIISVEDAMSDSGLYPAYIAYRGRGGPWRIKTLDRTRLSYTSQDLVSTTRTVKIYYLA